MKLISMTEFVLSHEATTDYEYQLKRHLNYAKFLKQPLKLEMFIPCDEKGNVLEKPKDWHKHISFTDNEHKKYQKAKEKVLFKDMPMNYIDLQVLKTYENKNKIIEDLFNETVDVDFILTENAIKQL